MTPITDPRVGRSCALLALGLYALLMIAANATWWEAGLGLCCLLLGWLAGGVAGVGAGIHSVVRAARSAD